MIFCEPSSLTPEKAMQSAPMHWERQIYLATAGEQELLATGQYFCHIWGHFLLKPTEE